MRLTDRDIVLALLRGGKVKRKFEKHKGGVIMTVPFQCRECACIDVDEYGKLYRTCGCVPSESIEQKMECLDSFHRRFENEPPREYLTVPGWAVGTRFAKCRL